MQKDLESLSEASNESSSSSTSGYLFLLKSDGESKRYCHFESSDGRMSTVSYESGAVDVSDSFRVKHCFARRDENLLFDVVPKEK